MLLTRYRPLRRCWSDDVKAQIVAESYAPGALVSEVARRHEISPQLLSAWRKAARHGVLKPADSTEPVFLDEGVDRGFGFRPARRQIDVPQVVLHCALHGFGEGVEKNTL